MVNGKSHVSQALTLTDCALNGARFADQKDILQNAIDFAHALDIEQPKVAILAAVEEVKPQMQSTIDAAALCKMADRGKSPVPCLMDH